MEIMIQRIPELLLTHLTNPSGQIISDETIVIREMLRAEFRHFPARQITVNTVKECCIGSHLRRERIKEAGCLQKHIHALIDIADKDH
jgi:hypothetical protein